MSHKELEKCFLKGRLFQLETMTMTISNLPMDLLVNIVSRVPLKYIRSLRLTCKKLNALLKSRSFAKMLTEKEAASRELGQTRMIVMMNYTVYLMGIVVNENPSIESIGKLTCLDDSEQVMISEVYHCEGLLLCILKDDDTKVVVWNPYLGQTKWIQTRKYVSSSGWKGLEERFKYALGYENTSCRNPKILRFIDEYISYHETPPLLYETYDFDSDSWTTLDVSPHWHIKFEDRGVYLKGNTYWTAVERKPRGPVHQIICFDFTTERFGPLLRLPFMAWGPHFASLSSVREENIVALVQTSEKLKKIEVWITTKIEANNVSWSNFFTMNTSYLDQRLSEKSFFIDEENKVALVFDKEDCITRDTITIIGEAGCLRKLGLGKPAHKQCSLCALMF